jgi:hypothetical protein
MQQDQASNIPSIFRDHRLFGTLRQDELSELFSSARTSQYRKGNSIFAKGAPGTTLMAILSGTVRISSTSVDGHDLIYALLSAGETFGEIALFSGGNRTADAIAESDCKLLAINRSSFTAFLTRHPEVAAVRYSSVPVTRQRQPARGHTILQSPFAIGETNASRDRNRPIAGRQRCRAEASNFPHRSCCKTWQRSRERQSAIGCVAEERHAKN